MALALIQTAFSAGEVAPSLYGHTDLAKFSVGASTMRNSFVSYRGGSNSRAGTALCQQSKQAFGAGAPRLATFQFSQSQGYCLEFGDHYLRFYSRGAPIVEAPVAITGATNAAPCVIATAASLSIGDWIFVSGVGGMTDLNGNTYVVGGIPAAGQISINNLNGIVVDSTLFGTYTAGGTLSRIFTLATPWAAGDVPFLKLTQSADVMTITHPSYPPYDLARISGTNWTITETTFGAHISPPAATVAFATVHPNPASSPPTLPAAYAYVVTAVDAATGEESVASPIANITDSVDIAATAGSHVIGWNAVVGAAYYNIYIAPTSYNTEPANPNAALPVPGGSIFSYIGTSYGSQFVNANIVPDFTKVPPIHNNPFAPGQILLVAIDAIGAGYTTASASIISATGSGFVGQVVIDQSGQVVGVLVQNGGRDYVNGDTLVIGGDGAGAVGHLVVGPATGTYPSACAYFQQRRVYANSNNNPDTYWMSQPGRFTNFDTAVPVSDTDSITGSPWSLQVDGIQFLEPMPGGLVVLAGSQVWQLGGAGSSVQFPQPITPASQQAMAQAFSGCHYHIGPIRINGNLLYVQAKGSIVRELVYNAWFTRYDSLDLTELSGQLFTGYALTYWAWCEEPYKVVWATRNDGAMLSLTYVKEQQVQGWARHDTFGQWLGCTAVTEVPAANSLAPAILARPGVDALYVVTSRPVAPDGAGAVYFIERMDDRLWRTIEDVWAVDCAVAYPQPTPAADIAALGSTIGPPQTFITDAPVFTADSVLQVIRMAGGLAVISEYVSPQEVVGFWFKEPSAVLTDVPTNPPAGTVLLVPAGTWTLTQPVSQVGGLSHLAGLTVTGLADGIPIPPTVVSADGTIALPFYASAIVVGLGFTAQTQTLYLNPQEQQTAQGKRKTITGVVVRTEASLGMQVGADQPDGAAQSPAQLAPAWSNLAPVSALGNTYTAYGGQTATEPYTGDTFVNVQPNWARPGQLAVQQSQPLPLNLTAVIPLYLDGDTPEIDVKPAPRGQPNPAELAASRRSGTRPWMGAS